ncbi:MAG: hypothetical protein ABSB95_09835 [Dissulfurispiraceae bacterium]|jgi:hypothetical protein
MDIEQFIETLSEEERQRHKDLIEECRLRSEETKKSYRKFFENPMYLQNKVDLTSFRAPSTVY